MQKKYFKLILVFIFLFIFNMNISYAATFKGKIIGTGVRLRSGPGTNYEYLKSISKDSEYMLVNDTLYKSEESCENGWYKIYYEGSATGFICSDFITVSTLVFNENPTNQCEQALKDLGFPSSYWPGLCSLKESHPNWQFKPILTGLDWSTSVSKESACGKSYIASSVPTNIDSTCTNQYTKTWYPASSSAVAYYMDPRNWFTEQHIFQFEYLKYDTSLESLYVNASTDVIDHSDFYNYHFNLGNNLGDIINTVGKETNVSPIFISSRILQEMGSGTSLYNLYSGIYEGFEEYYNFYNFGVTDSCATSSSPTICGLQYAKDRNWHGLQNAIKGGATQIANGYISQGQYTGYLQKFNVVPIDSNSLYTHQYMTNIAAPSNEAKTTYNTYNNLGLIDNVFVFYIPIYNDMENINYEENNGAIEVPEEDNTENNTTIDISTIITSSGYKYSSEYITGISPKTNVNTLKGNIESISGSNTVTIKNADDVLVTEGVIGTGFKVTINNSIKEETLTIVINGDTSGDGIINALDLLQVHKGILGTYTLSGVYNLAADTSEDGSVNALDLLQVHKNILGTYEIEQ